VQIACLRGMRTRNRPEEGAPKLRLRHARGPDRPSLLRGFRTDNRIKDSAAVAHPRAAFSLVRAWYPKDRNALKTYQPYAEKQCGGNAAGQRDDAAMNR
jgi:hypothetical protein